jgi:GT2 family glycosyltransferase
MDFSLVVVTMNRTDRFIRNIPSWSVLDSIREIIVVDYNSKDELYESVPSVMPGYKKMIFYRVENIEFFNQSKAYNIGIQKTTWNDIIKIDVDYRLINPNFIKDINTLDNLFYTGEAISQGGFLICKKRYIDDAGFYNENYEQWGYDDVDLKNRLQKIGCTRLVLPNLSHDLFHEPHSDEMRVENFKVKIKNWQSNVTVPMPSKRVEYDTVAQKAENYYILKQRNI